MWKLPSDKCAMPSEPHTVIVDSKDGEPGGPVVSGAVLQSTAQHCREPAPPTSPGCHLVRRTASLSAVVHGPAGVNQAKIMQKRTAQAVRC